MSAEAVAQLTQLVQQLHVKLDSVQAQLNAVQTAQVAKSRSSKTTTTAVGLGSNGQPEQKYPNNTLAFVRQQCSATNDFFKQYLNDYYPSMVERHKNELPAPDSKDYQVKLGEFLWKDLKELEKDKDPDTKKSASAVIKKVEDTWRTGKAAFNAAKVAAVPTPAPTEVHGLVAPVPVQTQTLHLDNPALTQPLVTPMTFQLPSLAPRA